MSNRLIKKFTKCKEGSLGYTLTEMLVVIGIIVALLAIAIPSVLSISKSLRFAQRNDYAKSIFMAAQANLTEMRADGGLAPLQREGLDSLPVQEEICGFPVEDWSPEYVYTSSEDSQKASYALVLPVGSVDGTLREQQVIIEYNPLTGNVYAVFYSEEKDQNILQDYREGKLPRNGEGDEKLRKDMMLGYYDGSGLSSAELEIERTEARITFENGEEGIVTVHIPMPDLYVGSHDEFMKGLEVKLTVTGEITKGEIKDILVKQSGSVGTNCKLAVDGKTVEVTYVLDSLANRMSFANLAAGTRLDPDTTQTQSTVNTSLTAIMDEDRFPIKPGENVTLDAEVTFTAANDRPNVAVQNAKLGGVNPMFGYLTKNLDNDKYTLTIENGRNLQNLNAIAPSVANKISSVAFTKDIYWNQTVAYYNQNYGTAGAFKSPDDEAPARALPYFVPIYNDALFGSAKFNYDERTFSFIGISITTSADVPTLSDGQDTDVANHAKISGKLENGNPVRIFNLNIDATKYTVPNNTLPANPTDEQRMKQGHYYVSMHNINQPVNYEFTGLFAYINTTIDSVHIVNPVVKGHPFVDGSKKVWSSGLFGIGGHWETMTVYGSPATGALVGASGYNTLITNCAAYVDTTPAASFDRSKLTQEDYDKEANQNWYGVSGEGAVGGLVGYAKSHRTTTGALTGDTKFLAFSNCFAAVNVSGNMRGNANKHFGYTNGVGGLVGNSELTNFYKCYASGNVRANGCYVEQTTLGKLTDWLLGGILDVIQAIIGLDEMPDLLYCGRRSMGAGGFVGTSHGTRYTNCFTTGNVSGYGSNYGAGGFVGIMSYEETLTYGNDEGKDVGIAQHTVFENCYAVGISRSNGQLRENFSGANARIRLDLSNATNYVIGSYYRALAPYYTGNLWNSKPGNTPTYSNYYIFKDSYYLVQEEGILQDNTNRCATVESYDNLMRMHQMQRNDEWIEDQIDVIKAIVIYRAPISGRTKTYDTEYFRNNAALKTEYENAYITGFPTTVWGNITTAKTHPYSLSAGNQAYPFTMITGLDYYGDWPARPLLANIAYYEDYADGSTGYYFNNEDTATLKHDQDVVSAGYAIISANEKDTVQVTIGGKTSSLQCVDSEVYTPGGLSAKSKYYVFRIPADLYQDVEIPDSFYLTANVYVKTAEGKEAWPVFYFNPYTAISHLTNAATAPAEAPQEVYIRTAQQLASLSREDMDCVWEENTTIIQQLNIDAATYDWNGDGAVTNGDTIPTLSAIGSADHPFNATYTGTGGYVAQAQIKGFEFAAPLFANVGDKGAVRNLSIEVDGGINGITIGEAKKDEYTALVAAVCSGDLENVDLTLTGNVTLKAKTAAGLLAGYIFGSEDDLADVIGCDITADTLSVSATNAGAVIGQAEYCDIRQGVDSENLPDDVTLTIDGNLTLTGTDVGAYLGASSDMNGDDVVGEVNVDGLTLTLNGIDAEAVRAGALAGTLEKGDIKNLTVSLTGAYSAAGEGSVFAGVAAVAKNGLVQNVTVTVNTNSTITADTAAGVFGSAENLTVQTTEVTVSGTITGTKAAAGLAASIEGGNFSGVNVKLMNATIIANGTEEVTTEGTTAEDGTVTPSTTAIVPTGRAAGFAVEIHGQVETGLVITPNIYDANGNAVATSARIEGNKEAAGFACEITAQVTGSRVAGTLNITANGKKVTTAEGGSTTEEAVGRAAGFAVKIAGNNLAINTNGVTPALENTAKGYKSTDERPMSNNNLKVNGGNAAMFAVEIGKGVNVRNCYALGKLTGTNVSGFADTNNGIIDGCSTNVTISGGNAFVRENTGTISTSYGWYGDGDANTVGTTATMEGNVVSSYFVDIDVPVTDENKSALMYDSKKNPSPVSPVDLTKDSTLELLNGDGGRSWLSGDSYGEYPYVKHIPANYPYPQLRPHYGNWATPPRYAYGVLYYEKYDNGTWKLQIAELSLEGEATKAQTLYSNDSFDETGNIVQAGYALFFKGETLDKLMMVDEDALGEAIEIPSQELSNIDGYSFVKLAENATITITRKQVEDETTTSITVNTRYAHEFGTVTAHVVRTEGQLAMIKETEAANGGKGTYSQTHDIVLGENSSFATITGFAGTYNGNGLYIQKSGATNAWMNGVSGTVENLELILGDLNTSFFGDVGGKVSLTQVSIDSLGANGRLVTNLNGSMTFTHVITADDLNPYHIRVGGQLSGVLIENVSGTLTCPVIEVGGDLAGKVIGTANADITKLSVEAQSISGTGAVIGTVAENKSVAMSLTCSGEISGSIVDTVTGSFTLNNNPNFGTVSGSLFDTVSGNVTLSEGVTVGTLSGMVCGNVTNTITANKLVDVTTVNELAMTTAENGTATVTGGAVFGNVSGTVTLAGGISVDTLSGSLVGSTTGTVTTNAVSVGTLDGSLVYALNDGTVTTGNIKVTTLNTSLVATFNGGTLSGTSNQTTVRITGEDGITVPVFTDVLGGTVKNYVVSGNVTLGGTAKGALVNTNNGTLKSLTLKTDTVTVEAEDNAVIGTLVGVNTHNLTDCRLVANHDEYVTAITITGTEAKSMTFGGLVGENSGAISGTTEVEANITYIQPINPAEDKKDSATIGGLVGKMSGGTLNGAYVTGSIDLTNIEQIEAAAAIAEAEEQGIELVDEPNPTSVDSNRSYIIGGAVGKAKENTSYSNVSSTVVVVDSWGKVPLHNADGLTDAIKAIVSPGVNGPVGQFVGYTATGTSFNGCSGNGGSATYQFLGQVQHTSWETFGAGTYGEFEAPMENTPYTQTDLEAFEKAKAQYNAEGKSIANFNVTLTNCYYKQGNATYKQVISNTKYYSDGTEDSYNSFSTEIVNPEIKCSENSNLTVGSFSEYTSQGLTKWYYLHTDGNYYPVWALYEYYDGIFDDGYGLKLWADINMDGTLTDSDISRGGECIINIQKYDASHWGGNKDKNKSIGNVLYEISWDNISNDNYMIVGSNEKALSNTNAAVTFIDSFTTKGNANSDLVSCIWTNDSGIWTSNGTYLNLNDAVIGEQKTVTVGIARIGASGLAVTMNGGKYLNYKNGSFSISDNRVGIISLFKVTEAYVYEITFENDRLGQIITAELVDAGSSSSITESDLPADGGEATQGTEVPEATGSNETATVPPTAEDGNNN